MNPEQPPPDPCGKLKWKWKRKAASGHVNDSNNVCKPKPTTTAKFSPLSGRRLVHRRRRPMQLRTGVGEIQLQVLHG